MEENNTVKAEPTCKNWYYTEKNNKHVTYHTISVNKDKFTHISEIKEASQAMRQRTDINVKNVNSVSSYYGLSHNLSGAILCVVFAILSLFAAVFSFLGKVAVLGIILIVVAALLGVLAYFVYKKIKPTFVLEIETIVQNGTLKKNSLAYGNAVVDTSKKHHSFFFYLLLVIVFPVGIIYLLSRSKGNKYKFEMDPAVGNEIVDTIGELLIEK